MPRLDGIDRARWQGTINVAALPPGIFVASQLGWRDPQRNTGETVVDETYAQVDQLRDRGDLRIIHYLVPTDQSQLSWRQQLDKFLARAQVRPGEAVMFDLEHGTNYEEVARLGWPAARAMMDEYEQRLGRAAIHYGDRDWMLLDRETRPKWTARYGTVESMWVKYAGVSGIAVWQWSGSGSCPGVSGLVDLNEIMDRALFDGAFGGAVATGESHNPALIKAWTSDYQTRKVVQPRGIVLHTIVNSGNVTGAGFRSGAHGTDSTRAQYVDRDGSAYEIQPADRKFICNWQGDEFKIGNVTYGHIPYETEDALGTEIGPYTPEQREAIIKALVEDCRMWGIPAVVPAVGDWKAAGIHYHSLHGLNTHHQTKPTSDPHGFNYYDSERGYWVRVVNPLTKTVGKTCPGADKIAQHAGIVAEVARRLAGDTQQPPNPEDVMNAAQEAKLDAVAAKVATIEALSNDVFFHYSPNSQIADTSAGTAKGYWLAYKALYEALPALAGAVGALTEKVDALAAKVDELEPVVASPVVFPNYGPLPS